MTSLPLFQLEEFWKQYEFNTPHLLCASDCESWSLSELMEMADEEGRRLWDHLRLGYTEVPGLPVLREEIARLYEHIRADQVLTLAGGEEGIYCAMRSLLSAGDHVVGLVPSYQSLETIASAVGAEVTAVELLPEEGWQLSLDRLERALRPNTKLIVITNPHNPTGMVMPRQVLDGIVSLAESRGAYVFSDEMYRFMELDEQDRSPSIADLYERGIALSGMAKPYGLAGLRMGWLVTQDTAMLNRIASYKVYTSICNSATSEVLALIALRASETLLQRNRSIVVSNLAVLDSFFERQGHLFSWVRPRSGPMGFVKWHGAQSVEDMAGDLAREAGVLILPGKLYSYADNYFRIGFGRRDMPTALRLFESWLG